VSNDIACRDLLELISGFLDDALPADTRQAVATHLEACDGCTMVLDEFRSTIEMTGMLSEEQITPEQRETLLAAFREWTG
jgi:anti-sigma factor RsiW